MKKFTESLDKEETGSRELDGTWTPETPQAKLRNQLSPFWTLSSILEDDDILNSEEGLKLVKSLVETCEKSKETILSLIKETEK